MYRRRSPSGHFRVAADLLLPPFWYAFVDLFVCVSQRIRPLLEAATDVYGREEWGLWLTYAQCERDAGEHSGKVYWRATKELRDPAEFIAQYKLLG
eukprot:6614196-Pyramimonas_sp.AAC.1